MAMSQSRGAETDGPGGSPFDTAASSVTRFAIEVVAWIAGPWAAAVVLGAWWWAIPTLVVLVALPAVFNTPGDKTVTGVPTPGPIRMLIELLLLVVAVGGAWIVWPTWVGVAVTVLGLAMPMAGLARYRWLASGAPPT
ncbi:MAG: hypothetical protein AAF531_19985 [Actinomycetota bacterium]